jgi:hypothetical protein
LIPLSAPLLSAISGDVKKTWWVRGPGSVSVVVFSSPQFWWRGERSGIDYCACIRSCLEIESGKLPFSSDNKNEMIIIRAQGNLGSFSWYFVARG